MCHKFTTCYTFPTTWKIIAWIVITHQLHLLVLYKLFGLDAIRQQGISSKIVFVAVDCQHPVAEICWMIITPPTTTITIKLPPLQITVSTCPGEAPPSCWLIRWQQWCCCLPRVEFCILWSRRWSRVNTGTNHVITRYWNLWGIIRDKYQIKGPCASCRTIFLIRSFNHLLEVKMRRAFAVSWDSEFYPSSSLESCIDLSLRHSIVMITWDV